MKGARLTASSGLGGCHKQFSLSVRQSRARLKAIRRLPMPHVYRPCRHHHQATHDCPLHSPSTLLLRLPPLLVQLHGCASGRHLCAQLIHCLLCTTAAPSNQKRDPALRASMLYIVHVHACFPCVQELEGCDAGCMSWQQCSSEWRQRSQSAHLQVGRRGNDGCAPIGAEGGPPGGAAGCGRPRPCHEGVAGAVCHRRGSTAAL